MQTQMSLKVDSALRRNESISGPESSLSRFPHGIACCTTGGGGRGEVSVGREHRVAP